MLKTPNKNSIKSTAIDVLSATGGAMLSEGVINIFPARLKVANEKTIRAGIAIVAAGGAAALQGKTAGAKALRMAFAGMSIAQILVLVKASASKLGITSPTENSTAVEKFVAGTFGLACGCDSSPRVATRMPRMSSLNASSFDFAGQKLENLGIQKGQPVMANAFD